MTKHKKEQKEQKEELPTENQEQEITADVVEEQEVVEEAKEENFEEKYLQLNDAHLRLLAEFDNYRKRTMREKADLLKTASAGVLSSVLPLVDDFERGLDASKNATDIDAVREGMDLIYGKFTSFLSQNGIQVIETENQVFDTEFHEALTTIPAPTEDLKGKIIDCVQKGYKLNDKVIRFSKVVVGE